MACRPLGAALNDPSGVAVDGSGNLFIADTWNCLVREVSASTGVISTLAGTPPDPPDCYTADTRAMAGQPSAPRLDFSNGVAVDGSGNVFIADPSSCVIRRISTSTGIISNGGGHGQLRILRRWRAGH